MAPGVVDLGVACGPGGTKYARLGADGMRTCQSCQSMWIVDLGTKGAMFGVLKKS